MNIQATSCSFWRLAQSFDYIDLDKYKIFKKLLIIFFLVEAYTVSVLKKEWNSNTCYNMDESWRLYAKWNKPTTEGQILYNST